MCDSMYNSCLDPVQNTNITTNVTAVVNATAMINSTSSFPLKTTSLNLTSSVFSIKPTGVVSGVPTASANSTGSFVSTKAASATSSGFSLPVLSTGVSSGFLASSSAAAPIYVNTTSTYAFASATFSDSIIPTMTGSKTAVALPAYSSEPEKSVSDEDACEV